MPPWASAAGRYMPSDVPLDGGLKSHYFYQQGCPAVQTASATTQPSNGTPECSRICKERSLGAQQFVRSYFCALAPERAEIRLDILAVVVVF